MKNTENNDLLVLGVDFVNNHIGEISDRQLIGPGNRPNVSDLRKISDTIGLPEDTPGDTDCGLGLRDSM